MIISFLSKLKFFILLKSFWIPELFSNSALFKIKKSVVEKIEFTWMVSIKFSSSFWEQSKKIGLIPSSCLEISEVIFSVSNSIVGEFP